MAVEMQRPNTEPAVKVKRQPAGMRGLESWLDRHFLFGADSAFGRLFHGGRVTDSDRLLDLFKSCRSRSRFRAGWRNL